MASEWLEYKEVHGPLDHQTGWKLGESCRLAGGDIGLEYISGLTTRSDVTFGMASVKGEPDDVWGFIAFKKEGDTITRFLVCARPFKEGGPSAGVGRFVVDEFHAHRAGKVKVILKSVPTAKGFHEKTGYKVIDTLVKNAEGEVDYYIMEKTLDNKPKKNKKKTRRRK